MTDVDKNNKPKYVSRSIRNKLMVIEMKKMQLQLEQVESGYITVILLNNIIKEGFKINSF